MSYPGRAEYRALLRDLEAKFGRRIMRGLADRYGTDLEGFSRAASAALGLAVEQEVRAHHARDEITVLTGPGLATKRITPAGIKDFSAGRWFAVTLAEAGNIAELATILTTIEREAPYSFLIRAKLIEGRDPTRVRRLLHPDRKTCEPAFFESWPRLWAGLDFDSFALVPGVDPVDLDAVATLAVARLPAPFQRASCWAQLTSGAGIKPGGRIRLFYWLDRPTSGAELKRWLKSMPGLDHATLNDVTPNYVARPLFVGVVDPVPVRSRLIAGEVDAVAVPDLPEPERAKPNPAEARDYAPPTRGIGFKATRAEQYMMACLRALAAAPTGQGRDRCMRVALTLYGLAKGGLLDPADATGRIKGVMRGRGWDASEQTRGETLTDVNRVLCWAWDHAQPRTLP